MSEDQTLTALLGRLSGRARERDVLVEELVDAIGHRAFPALILVAALIIVSPASGIPGLSSLGGLTIAVVAVQYICNRKTVWLPKFILKRSLPSKRLKQAIDFLYRPSGWADRILKPRLTFLAEKPFSLILVIIIMLLGLLMPLLEFLPFSSSIAAGAVSFLSLALLFRDGLLSIFAAVTLLCGGYVVYSAWLS